MAPRWSPSRRQPEPCVTGPASGLAPLPVDQWGDEAKAVLPRYLRRPELYLSGKPDTPPMPQTLGLFAHHVDLGAAWMTFTELLAGARSTLDPTLRELAIFRVAWRTGSVYEWKQHPRIGLGTGLTNAQLHTLPDGPVARALDAGRAGRPRGRGPDHRHLAGRGQRPGRRSPPHSGRRSCWSSPSWSAGTSAPPSSPTASRLEPDPPTEPVDTPELPAR